MKSSINEFNQFFPALYILSILIIEHLALLSIE